MYLTKEDIMKHLVQAVTDAGTKKAFAEQSHLSQAFVGDVLNGRREPSDKILKALGYRRVTLYERVR